MSRTLHIICWDIPFPADYGGVIDVFYKLKALSDEGVEIILHCFEYGTRKPEDELEKFCKEVYYYPRQTGWKGLHLSLPYIVSSRQSKELLQNLIQDDYPILFEGIHTTSLLNHEKLKFRKKIIRTHNVESDYYHQLALNASSWFAKCYYYWEASRLKLYEANLSSAQGFVAIAMHDASFFKLAYPHHTHLYCPGFQSHRQIESQLGKGDYCLYHGNLSIDENEKAALFLIHEVFNDLKTPLIIAGKNPSQALLNLNHDFIKIIPNPNDSLLNELIANAHINVLPSFQSTGLKLKLLHALFFGRFCLVNNDMLVGTELHSTTAISDQAADFKEEINRLMKNSFSNLDLELRKKSLEPYLPCMNAKKLTAFIFD